MSGDVPREGGAGGKGDGVAAGGSGAPVAVGFRREALLGQMFKPAHQVCRQGQVCLSPDGRRFAVALGSTVVVQPVFVGAAGGAGEEGDPLVAGSQWVTQVEAAAGEAGGEGPPADEGTENAASQKNSKYQPILPCKSLAQVDWAPGPDSLLGAVTRPGRNLVLLAEPPFGAFEQQVVFDLEKDECSPLPTQTATADVGRGERRSGKRAKGASARGRKAAGRPAPSPSASAAAAESFRVACFAWLGPSELAVAGHLSELSAEDAKDEDGGERPEAALSSAWILLLRLHSEDDGEGQEEGASGGSARRRKAQVVFSEMVDTCPLFMKALLASSSGEEVGGTPLPPLLFCCFPDCRVVAREVKFRAASEGEGEGKRGREAPDLALGFGNFTCVTLPASAWGIMPTALDVEKIEGGGGDGLVVAVGLAEGSVAILDCPSFLGESECTFKVYPACDSMVSGLCILPQRRQVLVCSDRGEAKCLVGGESLDEGAVKTREGLLSLQTCQARMGMVRGSLRSPQNGQGDAAAATARPWLASVCIASSSNPHRFRYKYNQLCKIEFVSL